MIKQLLSRRRFFTVLNATGLFSAITPLSGFNKSLKSGKKPNIVMIFADDMHYGALGVTGSINTRAKTPHIDSIFKQGVRFPNGYATHAVCAPSRAGLMTGRYQARFNFETLPGATGNRIKNDYGVDTKEVMIPQILKTAGYATCAIGKWHLGTLEKYQPNARGFDHWFGYRGSCSYYQFKSVSKAMKKGEEIMPEKDEKPDLDIVRNGKSIIVNGYLTEAFTDEATGWIEKNSDNPFFLYFAPYNVHSPDQAPKKYTPSGGGGHPHDGVIAALDTAVGKILNILKTVGIEKNTIVVFSNDNGGKKEFGNAPFNGNKATYYEGGVRVPFAIRWPDHIKPNSSFDGMVSTLDMLPTFAAVAGAKIQKNIQLDGKNLLPFLSGEKKASELRQSHYWRTGNWRAVRSGEWKMVCKSDRSKIKKLLASKGIIHEKGRKPTLAERDDSLFLKPELYNLSNDIGETTDVSDKYPEKLKYMLKKYKDWEATIPKWKNYVKPGSISEASEKKKSKDKNKDKEEKKKNKKNKKNKKK